MCVCVCARARVRDDNNNDYATPLCVCVYGTVGGVCWRLGASVLALSRSRQLVAGRLTQMTRMGRHGVCVGLAGGALTGSSR